MPYVFFGRTHTAMTTELPTSFTPGRVFRTRDLASLTANPTRTAKRWVDEGLCTRLRPGLYAVAEMTKFGSAPPDRRNLLRSFLDGDAFVITGPPVWNTLGLGSTQMFAHPLVYNRKRSGLFNLGGRTFDLRRVKFPDQPTLEWFVVDLLENLPSVCLDRSETAVILAARLAAGAFNPDTLAAMAAAFGTKATQEVVRHATEVAP